MRKMYVKPYENMTVLRPLEYRIYTAYDHFLYFISRLTSQFVYQIKLIWEKMRPVYFLYLDNEGRICKGKGTGGTGMYKFIGGQCVKVSGEIPTIDSWMIMPWKQMHRGYYDETLGAHVESKRHYKELMQAQGLSPLESNRYGKSRKVIQKEMLAAARLKTRKKREIAFKDACDRVGYTGLEVEEG